MLKVNEVVHGVPRLLCLPGPSQIFKRIRPSTLVRLLQEREAGAEQTRPRSASSGLRGGSDSCGFQPSLDGEGDRRDVLGLVFGSFRMELSAGRSHEKDACGPSTIHGIQLTALTLQRPTLVASCYYSSFRPPP